jgi:hypothetical protein
MPPIHYATYTTSAGLVIVLNDGDHIRFAPGGLPSGVFNLPFEQIGVETVANDPPEAYQTSLPLPRDIEMVVWVLGNSPSEVLTRAVYLLDALLDDVDAPARGVFTYTADNGVTRSIKCALANVDELQDWLNRFWRFTGLQDARARIPIKLRCQSPYWYNPTALTFASAFDGATPVIVACANAGRVGSYPRLTYSGAVTNPKVSDVSHSFELELDVAAGGVVAIDFDPAAFTCAHTPSGGAATNVANLQTMASREVLVAAGPDATLTFVASAGAATIAIAFNERQRGAGR